MNLSEIRRKIDVLDEQLLRLLNERADLVHEVGEVKKADGLEIYAPEREEQVYRSLAERNRGIGGRLPESAVRAVYREIMSASLALEKDLRIAYLGPEATFTHQAARAKFGASVAYEPQGSISEVFESVVRGRADYGVVPVENSWEGAVNLTLDMFSESDLQVCAQILMRIEHRLLANGPKELIRKVYSHPQAFGQCRRWLQMHLPRAEWVEVSSTTRAVELAAREEGAAAVAGRLAGELYGVPTLEGGIQDSAENTTRFLVIGQKASPATGADRTSLMFTVPHRPGALYRALECFDRFGINIGKIESRPSRKKAWEYCFFLDVDGHASDSGLGEALEALAAHCTVVKILGTFPQASEVE